VAVKRRPRRFPSHNLSANGAFSGIQPYEAVVSGGSQGPARWTTESLPRLDY
jgi:hypothetical protein